MEDLLKVGVITTTHGVRGEVKVYPTLAKNNLTIDEIDDIFNLVDKASRSALRENILI